MPNPKPRKKSFDELSNEEIALLAIDYVNKKNASKELDTQIKSLRKPLEKYLDASGRVLDSGSYLAVIPYTDVDVHLKKTLRMGKVLLPEAMEILRKNKLDGCIEKIEVIREDVLEEMYLAGKVSDEVLSSVYAEKPNFAFSVELKEKFGDAPE